MALKTKKTDASASVRLALGNLVLADLYAHYQGRYEGPQKQALDTLQRDRPEKYFELVSKHIPPAADAESKPDLSTAKSHADLGRKLLQSIGLQNPSDEQIADAVKANNLFIAALDAIKESAEGVTIN